MRTGDHTPTLEISRMRKLSIVLAPLLAAALISVNVATAQSSVSARQVAEQECKKLARNHSDAFIAAYGEGGTSACARRARVAARAVVRDATRRCRAMRGQSSRSRKAFRRSYRSRSGKTDAFRRCVTSGVRDRLEREIRVLLETVPECDEVCDVAAGPDAVPGTGSIVGEDRATVANPSDVWGGQDTPFAHGYAADGADDPYVERRSDGGDPHIAIGQTEPTPHYRRLITRAGAQSVYDRTISHGPSTRTQLQRMWFSNENKMDFEPGAYVFYLSFRLENPNPFPNPIEKGRGNSLYSLLYQFKSFARGMPKGEGNSQYPPLGAAIGSNGIAFLSRDQTTQEKDKELLHVPAGEWVRIALVANWSVNGWWEVWSDVDGKGMTKVIDRQTGIDLLGPRQQMVAWGLGFYHHMNLLDGTVPGQPRQESAWVDVANAQIARYQGQ